MTNYEVGDRVVLVEDIFTEDGITVGEEGTVVVVDPDSYYPLRVAFDSVDYAADDMRWAEGGYLVNPEEIKKL